MPRWQNHKSAAAAAKQYGGVRPPNLARSDICPAVDHAAEIHGPEMRHRLLTGDLSNLSRAEIIRRYGPDNSRNVPESDDKSRAIAAVRRAAKTLRDRATLAQSLGATIDLEALDDVLSRIA